MPPRFLDSSYGQHAGRANVGSLLLLQLLLLLLLLLPTLFCTACICRSFARFTRFLPSSLCCFLACCENIDIGSPRSLAGNRTTNIALPDCKGLPHTSHVYENL